MSVIELPTTRKQQQQHGSSTSSSANSSGSAISIGSYKRSNFWNWSYLAILFPIIIPAFHMILFSYLWEQEDVERSKCTCSCWDNVFKGPYERGVARYKHIYFNATKNTFKIWIVTILFFIGMYEIIKRIISLFTLRKLRLSMALLFFISFHSHYYAWWSMFNYWNDEFNAQWNHQLFFTITEMISTVIVVYFMDRRIMISPLPLLLVINIALAHILCGSWDNFVENVLLQKGGLHQVLRDLALMSTDIFYTVICLVELRNYAKSNGDSIKNVLFQKNHLTVLGWVTAILYVTVLFL